MFWMIINVDFILLSSLTNSQLMASSIWNSNLSEFGKPNYSTTSFLWRLAHNILEQGISLSPQTDLSSTFLPLFGFCYKGNLFRISSIDCPSVDRIALFLKLRLRLLIWCDQKGRTRQRRVANRAVIRLADAQLFQILRSAQRL